MGNEKNSDLLLNLTAIINEQSCGLELLILLIRNVISGMIQPDSGKY